MSKAKVENLDSKFKSNDREKHRIYISYLIRLIFLLFLKEQVIYISRSALNGFRWFHLVSNEFCEIFYSLVKFFFAIFPNFDKMCCVALPTGANAPHCQNSPPFDL